MCRVALIRELVEWSIAYGEDLEVGTLFHESNKLSESQRQVERIVCAIDITVAEAGGHIDEGGKIREQRCSCFREDVWRQLEGRVNRMVKHVE